MTETKAVNWVWSKWLPLWLTKLHKNYAKIWNMYFTFPNDFLLTIDLSFQNMATALWAASMEQSVELTFTRIYWTVVKQLISTERNQLFAENDNVYLCTACVMHFNHGVCNLQFNDCIESTPGCYKCVSNGRRLVTPYVLRVAKPARASAPIPRRKKPSCPRTKSRITIRFHKASLAGGAAASAISMKRPLFFLGHPSISSLTPGNKGQ